MKAEAVRLANAVHDAQRLPHAMDRLSSILVSNRMTFVTITGEGIFLEVCRFPRELGMFPSFFDLKQKYAVGSELIFRRAQKIDESRFENTITALKKGYNAIWHGHPGIGKSTEANFVLLEFLRHLGDGEDSGWPTKVAHRVGELLYLYTWNGFAKRVECETSAGMTLQDVEAFCCLWNAPSKQKPPVLFLELKESERDPYITIPTFIAMNEGKIDTVLKTIHKSGSGKYFLVRPHEPEELLLMAKLMFEADPESLCAHIECERSWDKLLKILSDRMRIVGPLVRQVFSMPSTFDANVEFYIWLSPTAEGAVTGKSIARLK